MISNKMADFNDINFELTVVDLFHAKYDFAVRFIEILNCLDTS